MKRSIIITDNNRYMIASKNLGYISAYNKHEKKTGMLKQEFIVTEKTKLLDRLSIFSC